MQWPTAPLRSGTDFDSPSPGTRPPLTPALNLKTPPDILVPANWQPMVTLTNVLGLPLNIVDTGQSGRLLPTVAKTRWCRFRTKR